MFKPIIISGDKASGKTYLAKIIANLFGPENSKFISFCQLHETLNEPYIVDRLLYVHPINYLLVVEEIGCLENLKPVIPILQNYKYVKTIFIYQGIITGMEMDELNKNFSIITLK